jgi:hypothetical protein
MAKQNFAATALYFERRAEKCPPGSRRQQLEKVAAHYLAKAEACGHRSNPGSAVEEAPATPPRRQRLIELFRAYEANAEAS